MFGQSLSPRALLAALPLLAAVEAQVVTTYVPNPNPVCTVQPYVVEYPVHIDTYIAANTAIIINGGVTININNAPTTLVTDVIATSTELVPVATIVPGAPFLLALAPAAPLRKRQTLSAAYLSGTAGVTADCAGAAVFALSEGQLSSGSELVSTNTGVAAGAFEVSEIVGNISTTFSLSGTTLTWANGNFTYGSGFASFCSMPSGEVVAVFTDLPNGCVAVSLVAVSPSTCISSTNTTGSITTGSASSTASASETPVTVTVTGSNFTSTFTTDVPVTTTSSFPTVTATANKFVLGFSLGGTKKRQTTVTEYITPGGQSSTNVLDAAQFAVVDEELIVTIDGVELLISTVVGADFAIIAGSQTPGTIFTSFAVTDSLTWTNGNFSTTDSIATYCTVISTSDVYAVFGTTLPDGCVIIALTATPVVDIPALNGGSTSSTSFTTTASMSSSSSGTTTTTGTSTSSSSSSTSSSSSSSPSATPTGSSNGTNAKMIKREPKPALEQYFV